MRKGWRDIVRAFALVLTLTLGQGQPGRARDGLAPGAGEAPVRLTVEVSWNAAPAPEGGAPAPDVSLEVTPGSVVGALSWPSGPAPQRLASGAWKLGSERSGRVRARVEAPLGASLLLRVGAGPVMRFPVASVLEGPQRTPPQSAVAVHVERLAWDALTVGFPEGRGDGTVGPGEPVPVTVGFNVLSPEATEVAVHCVAELRPFRGGPVCWSHEFREAVPANTPNPPTFAFPEAMPDREGTYVLELRATWEPLAAREREGGTVLSRLMRRGKRGLAAGLAGPSGASRRVTLAVVRPGRGLDPASSPARLEHDQEVESIDLGRLRGKPSPSASGRAPLAAAGRPAWPLPEEALTEVNRRDRLRGWSLRGGAEVARLAPADGTDLAWSAFGLKVNHPGRPHRLTLAVAGGHPAALGVALVGPAVSGGRPRLLLDACASGAPVLPEGTPVTFSWLVWPDGADPVLVLVNRAGETPVQVGKVTLTELAELPAGPAVETPAGGVGRGVGLDLTATDPLERFGASGESGLNDTLSAAVSLGQYAAYCGASDVVLAESLADAPRRRSLGGQAAEDSTGPDALDLTLRLLGRQGVAAWLDLPLRGPLPGLPDPASPEAQARGLVRVNRQGAPDGAEYHPLNPEVREALKRRVTAALGHHHPEAGAPVAGVLVRLGRGPTLLGSPDTGLDDPTYGAFIRESFDPATARGLPGLAPDDPGRFEARSRFIAGSGRMPWLTWRSRKVAGLYADLAAACRVAAPGSRLAVSTPGLTPGPAGTEARRADLNDLAPSLAWRAVGLDLDAWPAGESAPVVLRGVSLSTDDLAHDLATHPELDAKVAARTERGVLIDIDDVEPPGPGPGAKGSRPRGTAPSPLALTALPLDDGPTGDEPLGHAVAGLDALWVFLAAPAASGHEDRVRKFAQVFRALPATPAGTGGDRQPLAFGVSVRTHRAGDQTYVALANDAPYPVRLDTVLKAPESAPVYDLGRAAGLKPAADAAGRHLVLDLLPFGVAAVRVRGEGVEVAGVTPYPSDAVLTSLRTQYDALSAQLTRLSRGGESGRDLPPNAGFEPDPLAATTAAAPGEAKVVSLSVKGPALQGAATAPAGWSLGGPPGNALATDAERARTGLGCLRLDATAPPASAASERFQPHAQAALLVRAWFRADRGETKVRVWIEGEAGDRPYRRVSELVVGTDWVERAVQASDVPPGGLDSARVRFEMPGAGRLWVDDLTVSGETLSEPERRNARNALLAAMQAYREKRYADFSRLAGSHWARHPGVAAEAIGHAPEAVTDRPGPLRTGDASPLPRGRRLR